MILHCFSAPSRLDEAVERGYMCSFAGNVTYKNATDLQAAARDVPDELLLVETDSPYLAPQPVRGKPNEPANVSHTAEFLADLRGVRYDELDAVVEENAAAGLPLVSAEPRSAAAPGEPRRLRRFDVRPNRELGQNFLVDDNLLGVIGRAAELDEADVVLEVGGGLGVLSEYLAPRVAHLHVVEVDRSLEPALREALDPFGNASLHFADAVKLDFGALEPGAHQGGGQPALRRGRDGAAQGRRGAARREACSWRWCSARWGTASRRRRAARPTAPPRCWPSWPAR